jgi:hypothetical protein
LSDSSKRPGTSRDISELKARLGLKKPGAPAPAAKNGGGNAVVPPPGVTLPAPPGAAPAGPAVPSAKDDPFGAMNAMAQIGTMQRAPEIVIVNDGKPVEHVGAGKRTGTLVKYAIVGVVPLVLGIAIGKIAKEADVYNAGIADARALYNKEVGVPATKKKVVALQAALEASEKNGFRPDPETTKAMDGLLAQLDVKQDVVFRAKQNTLNAELSGQIIGFYAGVAEVRNMLQAHLAQAKLDDEMLVAAAKTGEDIKPQGYLAGFGNYRYGILISAPSATDAAAPFGAKLVELGKPYCSDGAQSATFECPDGKYSNVNYFDSVWTKGEPQMSGSSADAKKIIPLFANATSDGLLKGSTATCQLPGIAEALYSQRLQALKTRVDELIKTANSVETKLKPKANEADKFHFGIL